MISKIIADHINKYPKIENQDLYKLIFQSVLAGGHLISDLKKHQEYLEKEINDVKNYPYKELEIIGNDLFRIYLDGIKNKINLNTLHKLILLTANQNKRTTKDLEDTLLKVCKYIESDSFNEFINDKRTNNYPLVSHSENYRNMYKPHYRIIHKNYAFYLNLFFKIDQLLQTKKHVVLAIDGMAGSGKSFLANMLEEIYDANLIKLDDFFLQDYQRTKARLNEVGGNIDYERFTLEVLNNLAKENFSYKPYDCQTKTFKESVKLANNKLTIIEGSYSLRPEFIKYYDLKIFIKHDYKIQLKRLEKRNPKLIEKFIKEWLPKEELYHNEMIDKKALDLIFDTSTLY